MMPLLADTIPPIYIFSTIKSLDKQFYIPYISAQFMFGKNKQKPFIQRSQEEQTEFKKS
jgi:hypothetical protein